LGQCFDLLSRAFAAPGALLLSVLAKVVEMLFFHEFIDQRAVGGLSCGRCGGQQHVLLVRRDERRWLSHRVVVVARRVVRGIVGHVGPDGIELDVAIAGEQVPVGIDQCCLEASFPQGAVRR
jgi:hypothetical protein